MIKKGFKKSTVSKEHCRRKGKHDKAVYYSSKYIT